MNVTDKAGNTSNIACSKNYYADNTLPTVSLIFLLLMEMRQLLQVMLKII